MIRLSLADVKRLGLRIAAATPTGRRATVRRRQGRMPEDLLWYSVSAAYPAAEREYGGAISGRRYRIDVALLDEKIAIECDGWQYHGKFKSAHERDRERQNLLAVEGWLILRFTAGQIFNDMPGTLALIAAAVEQRRALASPRSAPPISNTP